MTLSPAARWVLGGIVTALTAAAAALPYYTGVPDWVGPTLAVLIATVGYFAAVPPQVGGTQQGIVNPSITEPPNAQVAPTALDHSDAT